MLHVYIFWWHPVFIYFWAQDFKQILECNCKLFFRKWIKSSSIFFNLVLQVVCWVFSGNKIKENYFDIFFWPIIYIFLSSSCPVSDCLQNSVRVRMQNATHYFWPTSIKAMMQHCSFKDAWACIKNQLHYLYVMQLAEEHWWIINICTKDVNSTGAKWIIRDKHKFSY